jgi:hypothetical protein
MVICGHEKYGIWIRQNSQANIEGLEDSKEAHRNVYS